MSRINLGFFGVSFFNHSLSAIIFFLAMLALSCDNPIDDTTIPEKKTTCDEIPCSSNEEFYGTVIMNSECINAQGQWFDKTSSTTINIVVGIQTINGISDQLRISMEKVANFNDTLWISHKYNNISNPELARVIYLYVEGHSTVGDFIFRQEDSITYEDYVIIDFVNEDTTIIEGRINVRFPFRSVNSFVTHAPDTMRIECGHFRAKDLF